MFQRPFDMTGQCSIKPQYILQGQSDYYSGKIAWFARLDTLNTDSKTYLEAGDLHSDIDTNYINIKSQPGICNRSF